MKKKHLMAFLFMYAITYNAQARADDDNADQGAESAVDRDDEKAKQRAAEYFQRGKILFNAEDYKGAAMAFEDAYATRPHSSVLGNIGMCYDRAEMILEAIETYRRYLKNPVSSDQTARIQERLNILEPQVCELDIACMADGCKIRADDEDMGAAILVMLVLPGHHKLEGVVDGEVIDTAEIEATAGGSIRVQLEKPSPSEPEPPPKPKEEIPQKIEEEPEEGPRFRAPFWILSGVAVASGITTAILGASALKKHNKYEDSGWTDADARNSGQGCKTATNVMIGITSAAGITAVVLAIYDLKVGKENKNNSKKAVFVTPGPGLGIGIGAKL